MIQSLLYSMAVLTISQTVLSQPSTSLALFDKLAAAVSRSDSQALVASLVSLMASPEMQRNPRKLRSEIVNLLKDKKHQKAADGRRTAKAIKLPPGIVKILNAKIPVRTKKQILDNVLRRLPERTKIADLKTLEGNHGDDDDPGEKVVMQSEEVPVRNEKSLKVSPVIPLQTGYLAANIAPSDSIYFGDELRNTQNMPLSVQYLLKDCCFR